MATSRYRPDVILTDIGLPGMSGIDGIAPLRKRSRPARSWPSRSTTATTRCSTRSAPARPATC